MKTNTKTMLALAGLLALGATGFNAAAQDAGGAPPDRPALGAPGGGGPRGFHLLPPRAAEQLSLTADQQSQLTALETETQAKLEKILTPEQMQKLKEMRPPMRPGGMRGPRNSPGGDNNLPPGPPPGDGDGNNLPPGPPPGGN